MNSINFKKNVSDILALDYGKDMKSATTIELYNAVSKSAMSVIGRDFKENSYNDSDKHVCYLSAEFLIGRMVYNNLLSLGLLNSFAELMNENGRDFREFEDIEDAALGNGGLGRLAACFLDSGATEGINLNGYGIRYRFGLFKQYFEDGFQKELPDDWMKMGDPWSIRHEEDKVRVDYKGLSVYAVPYDSPIIGYGGKKVNVLRLWQAEPVEEFDFDLYNDQKYDAEAKSRTEAYDICAVLYPNDTTDAGKKMRLKQQYFFASATIKDAIRTYKKKYENSKNKKAAGFGLFANEFAIQLNDTHPVVAIPEFIRILTTEEGVSFARALKLAKSTFAYTNHTILAEALEKWGVKLFKSVLPEVYKVIVKIEKAMEKELTSMGVAEAELEKYLITDGNTIYMARLAIYASHSTNGVAQIHSDILKDTALNEWYRLYPERFNNKTNGITQRRWLALANMELAGLLNDKIGNSWVTKLSGIEAMDKFKDDEEVIRQFNEIKQYKKRELCSYVKSHENGFLLDENFIFDIQVKRLHEYKRQLLNAFSILDIYYGIKEGRIKNFNPTAFIFGAKAAPGYFRAKGVIKFISEIAKKVNNDPEMKDKLQVLFVSNYNVSYAEKLTPAADISEQISTAGTEASGTGNMKFMMNGAVTLGTYDGANVEIVAEAGEENNYIFGLRVEDIERISDTYRSRDYYENNPRIKRVVDSLVDGTFDDGGTGMFKELYTSLLDGASWHKPDHYYILADLIPYVDMKLKANSDYADRMAFGRKCFINMAHSSKFSSDRTIRQYYEEIWKNK